VVPGADQPSIASIIPALGDFKKGLLDRGVNFHLSYIQDTFGNPIGGAKQGATYGSVLYMAVDADLAKHYHFGIDGRSLADPLSNGQPLVHIGDFGVYGVIDQMLWRWPDDDPKKGIGGFARVAASSSDRNLMSFYAEAGVNFMGMW
jgi:carbohydrate-selective porin OprB